jgi:hypothetical protein
MRDVRFERIVAIKNPFISFALNNGVIDSHQVTSWIAMDAILINIFYVHSSWLDFNGVYSSILITSEFRHQLTNVLTEGVARNSEYTKAGLLILLSQMCPQ